MKTLETVNYLLKLFISYDFRCAPAWESSKYIIYTWYWLVMGFLLPLVINIYANFKTVQCLKKVGIIAIRIFLYSDMFFMLSHGGLYRDLHGLVIDPKLHIPSTLNIDLILWHTQLILCAVKY